jgi:AcrR family transcriptional regulator
MGYERATMSEIAGRAHSSIGSLYQFFPNKKSVADALHSEYSKQIEQRWLALAKQSARLSGQELACRLVTLQLEIVRDYPALLALLDMPPSRRVWKRRELMRARIAGVLTAQQASLSSQAALRIASVIQQVSRAMLMLYAKTEAGQKREIVDEFKAIMTGYLVPKLKDWRLKGNQRNPICE